MTLHQFLAYAAALGPAAPPAAPPVAPVSVRADVNCDGYGDAVVGVPGHRDSRGALHVLYGARDGLHADGAGDLPQDQFRAGAAPGHRFGATLATADFDADGCADIAALAPGDAGGRGVLVVLRGSPDGLRGTPARRFVPGGGGVPDVAEPQSGDPRFAAAGDFDGDGRPDLALGFRGDTVAGTDRGLVRNTMQGSVTVFRNGPGGLGSGGIHKLHAGSPNVPGEPEDGDSFGVSLAAGDFDGDGVDDLAVGVSGEDPREVGDATSGAGAVVVLPGAEGEPLGSRPGREIDQDTAGVPGASEYLDSFGTALAAGDVTGDGRDDLAVGVLGENHFAGSVVLLTGSADGLSGTGSRRWSAGSPGVPGVEQDMGFFGIALEFGRFDGDRYADLAVGWDHPAAGPRTGAVVVLRGSARGLTADGAEFVTQRTASRDGRASAGTHFGWALTVLGVRGGPDRLVVGGDDTPVGGVPRAGAVWDVTGKRRWTADSPGVRGAAAPNAHFGQALG